MSVDLATDVEQAKESSPTHYARFGFRFVTPLALGSTLNPINSTMISTALVAIARDYHASVAQTGWLIAGLYLTSAIAQPTMGRLGPVWPAPGLPFLALCRGARWPRRRNRSVIRHADRCPCFARNRDLGGLSVCDVHFPQAGRPYWCGTAACRHGHYVVCRDRDDCHRAGPWRCSDRILRVALDFHGEPSPLAAHHPPRSSVGFQRRAACR